MTPPKAADLRQDRKAARGAEKKRQLARHALSSLSELGYARTNLRDVAQRSGVSLGVIHYYFADKTELLAYSIALYKEDFVRGIRDAIADAATLEGMATALGDIMAQSVADYAEVHRLWYDVRAQAQYEPGLRQAVEDVESALQSVFVILLAKLAAWNLPVHDADPLRLYLILDGWFRHFLQRHLSGDVNAASKFRSQTLAEFARLYR